MRLAAQSPDLVELMKLDRHAFAAKVRLARAVLGWSQSEFGRRVGMTQRAIHKLEQGETDPRRSTMRAIEQAWRMQGISFEDLSDGSFRAIVRTAALKHATGEPERPRHPRLHHGAYHT